MIRLLTNVMNNTIENTIEVRVKVTFRKIFIDYDNCAIYYLGYRLHLTKSEFSVLKVIIENDPRTHTASDISNLCERNITPKSVLFHVHNINKKAFSIGKRVLISNKIKIGYFLNKEM